MQNFWTIYKLLFCYLFKRDKTKDNWWKFALLTIPIIVGIGIAIFIILGIVEFSPYLEQEGLLVEFLSSIMFVGMFVVFVLGLVPTITYMYLSKDADFFASLPIGNSSVYFARLAVTYFLQLLICSAIMLPVTITLGVVLNFDIIFYLAMLVVVLSMPILPLLATSILAMPAMYIVSFFKKRAALTSILFIILFGIGFVTYFFIINNAFTKGNDNESNVVDASKALADFFRNASILVDILAPLSVMTRVAIGQNNTIFGTMENLGIANLVNLTSFVIFFVFVFAILRIISGAIYMRGVIAQLENSTTNAVSYKSNDKYRSVFWSLVSKEFKEMIRTPAYAVNCLFTVVLAPILSIVMTSSFSTYNGYTGDTTSQSFQGIINIITIFVILMIGAGINVGAATTISREGDKFYLLKILPVDYHTQVKAKLLVYRIISLAGIILSLLSFSINAKQVLLPIKALPMLFMYSNALISFVAILDLSRPKLKWSNPSEVIKRNINVQLPTFLSLAIIAVLTVLSIVWYVLGTSSFNISMVIVEIIMWIFLYFITGVMMFLFGMMLKAKTIKYLERIEV
ncbi:MAG: hypothetical protein FWF56_02520 [Firmicutes bacterium]|nr:hypothetical protein [Bacillota bacterium]MCL1954145.1 hypothetical protein [Bacillota bacterium]